MICSVYIIDNLPEGQGICTLGDQVQPLNDRLPEWWALHLSKGVASSSAMSYSSFGNFLSTENSTLNADYIMFASSAQEWTKEDIKLAFCRARDSGRPAVFFGGRMQSELRFAQWEMSRVYGCRALALDCNAHSDSNTPFTGLVVSRECFSALTHMAESNSKAVSKYAWSNTSRALSLGLGHFFAAKQNSIRVFSAPSPLTHRSFDAGDDPRRREMRVAAILGAQRALEAKFSCFGWIQKQFEKGLAIHLRFREVFSLGPVGALNAVFSVFGHTPAHKINVCPQAMYSAGSFLPSKRAAQIFNSSCDESFCRIEAIKLYLEVG